MAQMNFFSELRDKAVEVVKEYLSSKDQNTEDAASDKRQLQPRGGGGPPGGDRQRRGGKPGGPGGRNHKEMGEMSDLPTGIKEPSQEIKNSEVQECENLGFEKVKYVEWTLFYQDFKSTGKENKNISI